MKTYLEDSSTKPFCITAIICIILLATALVWFAVTKDDSPREDNKRYSLTARVIEVNGAAEIVAVEDSTGNIWEFCGNGFKVGEILTLEMDSNGTETIYDDEIVNAF